MHTAGPPVARTVQSLGPVHQPMLDMLSGVVEYGTGRAASVGGFAAGKTGTSQNHRDAWFIGFTNSLIVGVWVGNDDNTPMRGVVGGTLPASIWRQFVRDATPLLDLGVAQVGSNNTFAARPVSEHRAACDVQACNGRYRSFRASDCTYRSFSGERRRCKAGYVATGPAASSGSLRSRRQHPMMKHEGRLRRHAAMSMCAPGPIDPSTKRIALTSPMAGPAAKNARQPKLSRTAKAVDECPRNNGGSLGSGFVHEIMLTGGGVGEPSFAVYTQSINRAVPRRKARLWRKTLSSARTSLRVGRPDAGTMPDCTPIAGPSSYAVGRAALSEPQSTAV